MSIKLYEKLIKLQWLLYRYNIQEDFAETIKYYLLEEERLLKILQVKDGISINELSYLLGTEETAISESLMDLEEKGYLFFKSVENNSIKVIYLTRKGHESKSIDDEKDIFNCLSKEEKFNFEKYINRIIKALEKVVEEDLDVTKHKEFNENYIDGMGETSYNIYYDFITHKLSNEVLNT